jgi:hypothetical protein
VHLGNLTELFRKYLNITLSRCGLTTHLYPVPRLRMRGAVLPLPQYAFMVWCLVKHRGNFITEYLYKYTTCVVQSVNYFDSNLLPFTAVN